MSDPPIPVLIVAGFLGAGKTTLIRELLPRLAHGPRQPFVILNDYLNADIDAATLRDLGARIQALPAGCVCCDDSRGLVDAILAVPAGENPILILEANGTTDPYRLIEVLTLTRALRERLGPVLQLTVLNEARFGKRLFPGDRYLEKAQVRTASAILTNRAERASDRQRRKVSESLIELNPRAPRLDLDAFVQLLRDETAAVSLPAPDTSGPMEHAHHHVAVRLEIPEMDEQRLRSWLLSLPCDIQRAKGVVKISDEEICYFQRTDDPFESPTLHKTRIPEGYEPCAVFIGHGLTEKTIRNTLTASPAIPGFKL